MDIWMTAKTKTLDDVVAQYQPGDESRVWPGGSTMLTGALGNTDPDRRFEITMWVLDRGADPSVQAPGAPAVLEILLGVQKHNVEQDVVLARRLIAGGANAGFVGKGGATAGHYLARLNQVPEEEMAELDEIILSAPGVVTDRPNASGVTPAKAAEILGRTRLAERLRAQASEAGER